MDINGSRHVEGQFDFLADADFNTGTLRQLEPQTELVFDHHSVDGSRLLAAVAPDDRVDAILEALRKDPHVRAAGRNYPLQRQFEPNDPSWPAQKNAGLALLGLPRAWDLSRGHPSVRVAVVDSGVNAIPDLVGRLDPGINVGANPPSENVQDTEGHGTMLASIIAAQHNSTDIAGIAPNIRIVPVKTPENVAYLNLALDWIKFEHDSGSPIHVVNVSFGAVAGGQDPTTNGLLEDLDERGMIVVASAGNAGESAVFWPASNEHVIAVGGTDTSGGRDYRSNYGSALDVAAPYQNWARDHINSPVYFEGTSSSTAVVAGLAALFKSTQPQLASLGSSFDERVGFMRALSWYAKAHEWDAQTGYGVPDAWELLWPWFCWRFDYIPDGRIDVYDAQYLASRHGADVGQPRYDVAFDLHPPLVPDGDVDIVDLQRLFGLWGSGCPS